MKKNYFLLFLFFLLFLMTIVGLALSRKSESQYLMINNHKIFVEVADDFKERSHGLADREFMAENRGMLFVFPRPGNYLFWMKGMKFNLDFIFIRRQKIVDLIENVPFPKTGEEPRIVKAKADFDKVLEINQGMIKKMNIKIGSRVGLANLQRLRKKNVD